MDHRSDEEYLYLSPLPLQALDVALVKATSSKTHVPPKEKHVQSESGDVAGVGIKIGCVCTV